MNLELTAEEKLLRETFGTLLERESSQVEAGADERWQALWKGLINLGVVDLASSLDDRGELGGLFALSLITKEQGRNLTPAPLVEIFATIRLLTRVGGSAATDLLDGVRSGETIVAALDAAETNRARVVAGMDPAAVIWLDRDRLLARYSPAPAWRYVTNDLGSASFRVYDLSARMSSDTLLSDLAVAPRYYAMAVREAMVLTAAALTGISEAALSRAVAYAKTRHQFGRAIAQFQSIAHQLADAAAAADASNLLTLEAIWAAETYHRDADALACMAVVAASEAASKTTSTAVHVHGGYGITMEYDVQAYYRMAKAWALPYGDPQRQLLRAADAIFTPSTVDSDVRNGLLSS